MNDDISKVAPANPSQPSPPASASLAANSLSQTILSQMSDAVVATDLQGTVLFWNRGAERLYGQTAAEMVGQPLSRSYRYDWLDPGRQSDVFARIRRNGKWFGNNLQTLRAGRQLLVESEVWLLHDDEANEIAIVAIMRDVTARRHDAVEQVTLARQQEALLRALLDGTSDLISLKSVDGRYLAINAAATKAHGKPTEQILGKTDADLFPPDQAERIMSTDREVVRTGSSIAFEQDLWLSAILSRVQTVKDICRDANGNVFGVVGISRDITERRAAQQALDESQSRFRKLFESGMMAICIPDRFGLFTEGNDEFLRIVGYSRADLAAGLVRWDTMTPPEYAALDAEHIAEAAERGNCTPYEKEYIRKDGTRVPILCGYALLEGSQDQYIGFVLDMTTQKKAESALIQTGLIYRSISELVEFGVWTTDREGHTNFASESLLRLIGISPEQASRFTELVNVHPDDAPSIFARWNECVRTGGTYDAEFRIRCADGEFHTMIGRAEPMRDAHGQVTGWAGINLDIDRFTRTEAAVREREQRFSALADSVPQLVWVSSPEGGNTYVNQRYLDYTGRSAEDLMDMKFISTLHPDDRAATIALWQRSVSNGEPFTTEYRVLRHDGVWRHFLGRAVPVRDESGQILRWIGSSTDIHDQKLAEEALRRSEKLAAAGRLAATVAHEINNPLAAVTNTLYLALLDPDLNPDTRSYLNTAEQELARVAQVATQTLRFHRQSYSAADVDLANIVESVFALFSSRLRARAITVQRDYRNRVPLLCFGDELRQVFANLIGNAIDAIAPGGTLRVRVCSATSWKSEHDRGTPGIRVLVADSGHGIPAHLVSHVFEAFVSTKDATGTGLGLWVTEGIVRKHGGTIRFRTSTAPPRHGTVFSVFFPLDGAAGAIAADKFSTENSEQGATQTLSSA